MGTGVPGASFGAWIVALLFLTGLAVAGWAIVRYVRRSQGQGAGMPEGVRVLARIPMGVNHAIVLVEMVDHVLVVGVGDAITLIERIDDADQVKALLIAAGPAAGPFGLFQREHLPLDQVDFRRILDDALGRIRRRGGLGRDGKGGGKDA